MEYTLYWYQTDDGGGYGICHYNEFNQYNGDNSVMKIGDFTTTSELADLLYDDDPSWCIDEPGAYMLAMDIMRSYRESEV